MKYVINGEPIALRRPRFGGHTVYDSQKKLKLMLGITLASQHEGPLLTGPLAIDIIFYFKKAKSRPRVGYVTKKPDIDNCIKMVLDLALGIIYEDDALIASLAAKKIYDNDPRTEFTIKPLS